MLQWQKGQSLVQVMVAAVIMGIVMMSFLSMQSNQQKAQSSAQSQVTRNMLQILMQQTFLDQAALTKAIEDTTHAGNVALKKCLQPSGATCDQTASPQGFVLYDNSGTPIAGAGSSAPILYDDNGSPCAAAAPKCIFQIYVTYSALCPGGTSPCSNPSVTASYTIQSSTGINPKGGTPLKPIQSQAIPIVYTAGGGGGGGGGMSDPENQAIPSWPNNVTCTSAAGNSAVLHIAKLQKNNPTYHVGYVKAESGGDSSYIWFDNTGKLILKHWADSTSDAINGCAVGANISTFRTTN
jgi:Tfp pilus assembly protein PilE